MIFKHKKHEVLVQLSQSWQVLVVFVILKIALSGSIQCSFPIALNSASTSLRFFGSYLQSLRSKHLYERAVAVCCQFLT